MEKFTYICITGSERIKMKQINKINTFYIRLFETVTLRNCYKPIIRLIQNMYFRLIYQQVEI